MTMQISKRLYGYWSDQFMKISFAAVTINQDFYKIFWNTQHQTKLNIKQSLKTNRIINQHPTTKWTKSSLTTWCFTEAKMEHSLQSYKTIICINERSCHWLFKQSQQYCTFYAVNLTYAEYRTPRRQQTCHSNTTVAYPGFFVINTPAISCISCQAVTVQNCCLQSKSAIILFWFTSQYITVS